MADETRKIVHLVGTSAQGAAGGGRKGLLMHDTDAATLRMQLDAEGNYAFYARRDAAQTFTGVQTFQNGVVASTLKVTGQAGTGPRMVQAAADGTQSAVGAATARATLGAQAALGYTPVNKAGDTMNGALTLSVGNLNVGAGEIQTAGVTRISNGGDGTLKTLNTTGLATLNSLKVTGQAGGSDYRSAMLATDGTLVADGSSTTIRRRVGYVAVRNVARLAGEDYEFWDSGVGYAGILCGQIRSSTQAGTGNRLVQASSDGTQSASIPVPTAFIQTLLNAADAAAARSLIGAASVSSTGTLIYSDFGKTPSGESSGTSAFADNTSANLQLAANSIVSGTRMIIEQLVDFADVSKYRLYQLSIGPLIAEEGLAVSPQYFDLLMSSDTTQWGYGRIVTDIEFIGSGASVIAHVTCSILLGSGSTKTALVRCGKIAVNNTLLRYIDIRFKPVDSTGAVIRRNRIFKLNP